MKLKEYKDYNSHWIANDRCEDPGEVEQYLIANRDDIDVLASVEDEHFAYEYDQAAVISLKKKYYLLHTSGCSCPSPSETWSVLKGPSTLKEIRKEIKEDNNMHLSNTLREQFISKLFIDN